MILKSNKIVSEAYLFVIAWVLLLAVPGYRSFFVILGLYGIAIFFLSHRSLKESFFLTLLLSLPFEKPFFGWFNQVVPAGPDYWHIGYSYYFSVSAKLILTVICLLLVIKENKTKWNFYNLILILLVLVSAVSTSFSPNLSNSLLGLIRIFQLVGIYMVGSVFFRRTEIREIFLKQSVILLFFISLIGVGQLIKSNHLGLFLEENNPLVVSLDSYTVINRIQSIFSHATVLGNFMAILVPVVTGYLFEIIRRKKVKKTELILISGFMVLALLSTAATYTRSAWVAILIVLVVMAWKWKKEVPKYFWIGGLVVVSLTILFLGKEIGLRLEGSKNISEKQNLGGRLELIQTATLAIKEKPIWGIGLNNSASYAGSHATSLYESQRPKPIQNTFILMFTEIGIMGGALFCLFFISILWMSKKNINNPESFGLWMAVLSFVMVSQFHMLFNLDPILDFVMVVIACLMTNKTNV